MGNNKEFKKQNRNIELSIEEPFKFKHGEKKCDAEPVQRQHSRSNGKRNLCGFAFNRLLLVPLCLISLTQNHYVNSGF